ncbi:hypothetical protein M3Y97_00160600 [Aphelenchoides bicaudatus]|nr:hypothetical protein M3Y97_00160600 [Aphelenchoides bicaudatus]
MPSSKALSRYPQNWAVVCVHIFGKRFELACEKDMLEKWRLKTETNPKNVIATNVIFSDTQRGIIATDDDLLEVFETTDRDEIAKQILESKAINDNVRMNDRLNIHRKDDQFLNLVVKAVVRASICNSTGKPFDEEVIKRLLVEHKFDLAPFKNKSKMHGRAKIAVEFLKQFVDIEVNQHFYRTFHYNGTPNSRWEQKRSFDYFIF